MEEHRIGATNAKTRWDDTHFICIVDIVFLFTCRNLYGVSLLIALESFGTCQYTFEPEGMCVFDLCLLRMFKVELYRDIVFAMANGR